MNKKKLLSVFLAFGLVCSYTVKVFADPSKNDLDSQKANIEKQVTENQNTKTNLQNQIGNLESQIEMLDTQIQQMMVEIQKNNDQINKVQGQIKQTEDKIAKAEADIKDEQDLFDKRMKVMYVEGNGSYLEIILDSKGLSDFLSKVESVKMVADYDKKMINDLNEKRETIVAQKTKLDQENANLQKLKKDNEDKLASLNTTKANENKIVLANKKQIDDLNAKNTISQQELDKIKNQLASMNNTASTGGSKGSTGGSKGSPAGAPISSPSAVIQYAMQFLGRPYVWGTRGPNTFDCSGFVQFVYRNFGYEVGSWTGEQRDYGKAVSRDQLQPGDMIFFGPSYEGIHHVALYVGDGWYIHAPKTGDVVKLSRLSDRSDYYSARRVIY